MMLFIDTQMVTTNMLKTMIKINNHHRKQPIWLGNVRKGTCKWLKVG